MTWLSYVAAPEQLLPALGIVVILWGSATPLPQAPPQLGLRRQTNPAKPSLTNYQKQQLQASSCTADALAPTGSQSSRPPRSGPEPWGTLPTFLRIAQVQKEPTQRLSHLAPR